jgi:hypothetical protein
VTGAPFISLYASRMRVTLSLERAMSNGRSESVGADKPLRIEARASNRALLSAAMRAGACRDIRPDCRDEGIEVCARRLETFEPSVREPCLEPANECSDTASELLHRGKHLQSLAGGREHSPATAAFGGLRNPPLQVSQGRCHLGIGRVGHALAFDFDGAHTAKRAPSSASRCAVISSTVIGDLVR